MNQQFFIESINISDSFKSLILFKFSLLAVSELIVTINRLFFTDESISYIDAFISWNFHYLESLNQF